MKMLYRIMVILALCSASGFAQSVPWEKKATPAVIFSDHAVELQTSLYPMYYQSTAAIDDMRWVSVNSTELIGFWQLHGDSILLRLSDLSGLPWFDNTIDVILLRYYPTTGSPDPFIFPIGGVRVGALTEAMPRGPELYLAFIYQLAHRMLWQGEHSRSQAAVALTNHPLAQPGPYYRDLLAMHLTLSAASQIPGGDTIVAAFESGFWRRHFPARELYEQYMRNRWRLSPDKPLMEWLSLEAHDSKLLQAASPMMLDEGVDVNPRQGTIEGVPPSGRLGFSVRFTSDGQLAVDRIDESRSAYLSGLRQGDIITRVAGRRVQSHRDLMEELMAGLERGATAVQVSRDGRQETVIIRLRR